MKRRLTYALAGLALLLSVAAGAVAAEIDRAAGLAVVTNGTLNVEDGSVAPPPADDQAIAVGGLSDILVSSY